MPGSKSARPLLLNVAMVLTFFNSFVLLEEFVIDRHGLWRYLPFYKVGAFCLWDIGALLVIGVGVWWVSRRG